MGSWGGAGLRFVCKRVVAQGVLECLLLAPKVSTEYYDYRLPHSLAIHQAQHKGE